MGNKIPNLVHEANVAGLEEKARKEAQKKAVAKRLADEMFRPAPVTEEMVLDRLWALWCKIPGSDHLDFVSPEAKAFNTLLDAVQPQDFMDQLRFMDRVQANFAERGC